MALTTPSYVITLVHGTWASNAEWTQENSQLSRKLRDELGGHILIKQFRWSGKNSYGARREAGEKLRQCLCKLTHDYPDAQHLVIAHSHGGNIALYGLNDPQLAEKIAGLVTLATPFLTCTPKNFVFKMQMLFNGALFGLGFSIISYVVLPLVLRGLEYSHTLDRWMEIGVYVGVLWLGYAASTTVVGVAQDITSSFTERFTDVAGEKQSELLSMLTTPHCARVPLLALRFKGDEARLYLAFLAIISMPFSFAFSVVGYVFVVVYSFAALMITADVIAEFARAFFHVWVPTAPWVLTRQLYWVCLSILGATFVGVLTLPRFLRGHSLGFGKENLLTSLLVRIVPMDSPEGLMNVNVMRYSLLAALGEMTVGRGLPSFLNFHLLHSWLYQDDHAIQDIIGWIKRVSPHKVPEGAMKVLGIP